MNSKISYSSTIVDDINFKYGYEKKNYNHLPSL